MKKQSLARRESIPFGRGPYPSWRPTENIASTIRQKLAVSPPCQLRMTLARKPSLILDTTAWMSRYLTTSLDGKIAETASRASRELIRLAGRHTTRETLDFEVAVDEQVRWVDACVAFVCESELTADLSATADMVNEATPTELGEILARAAAKDEGVSEYLAAFARIRSQFGLSLDVSYDGVVTSVRARNR